MAEIILNPYNSLGESAFDTGSLLHQEEFERVIKKVDVAKEVVYKLNQPNEDKNITEGDNFGYYYNTITVLGSRGSGKTSFLLSLLKRFKEDKDIYVMDLIDPTKVEEKGHVFLTILSLLDKEVKKHLTECANNPENKNFRYQQEWRDAMKSMAAGLPYLDGIGHGYQDWQDEEFIMDNGLKCVGSAIDLKTDFERLVKLALQIIGNKKIIVIAFDDIDTDFRKGWLVMETLRKYLNIPQIVTFASGDQKLLTKGIRKHQWKSFGKALLVNEGEHLKRMSKYDELVSEMESQYMQKVLPTQNWVSLSTISEMMLKKNSFAKDIKVIIDGKSKKTTLIDFYYSKLAEIGICNGYQAISYVMYLVSLPIRMQLQIILVMQDKNKWNIINPFVSSLMVKDIDVDLLKANEWRIVKEILQMLVNHKCLDEAYQMPPTMIDSQMNDCLFALGSMFSLYVKENPHLIFDYWLSIGHTRNLLTLMPLTGDGNANIVDLCSFVDIGLDNVYRNISCKKEVYIRAALSSKKTSIKTYDKNWGGTIILPGLAERQKKNQDAEYGRIDSVFDKLALSKRCIAYMPLMITESSRKQRTLPLYSINVLLSTIGEIIRYINNDKVSIKQILSNCSQIRSFVMPEFNSGVENDFADIFNYDNDSDIPLNSDKDLDSLVVTIKDWAKTITKESIAPYLLGKISTRIFYASRSLDDVKSSFLGNAAHRRIVAILNSILIEEAKEKIPDILVNSNNAIQSDRIFINNLKVLSNHSEKLNLSRMMIMCPLITAFIDQSGDLVEAIEVFLGHPNNYEYSIFKELQQVII